MKPCNRRVITPTWTGARRFSSQTRSVHWQRPPWFVICSGKVSLSPPQWCLGAPTEHTATYLLPITYFTLTCLLIGKGESTDISLVAETQQFCWILEVKSHSCMPYAKITFSTSSIAFHKWQPCKGMSWGCLFKVSFLTTVPALLHPYEEGMCGNRDFSVRLILTQLRFCCWQDSATFQHKGLLPLSGGTQ